MADVRAPLHERLLALFVDELDEAISVLSDGLVALARHDIGADDAAHRVRELFRRAHGIKGAAHSAGVEDAVHAARRLEDRLARLRDSGDPAGAEDIAVMLADVDALSGILTRLRRPEQRASVGTTASDADARRELRTVRVASDSVDALIARSRSVQHVADDVVALLTQLTDGHVAPGGAPVERASRRVRSQTQRLRRLSSDMGAAAVDLTLRPFAEAVEGLQRVVHDIATAADKQVALDIGGTEVRVDRAVIEILREPLGHLVRNAVDHGIEPPAERGRAGKPPHGTLSISARIERGWLEVVVRDDGRGVDTAALRAAAARRGVAVEADDTDLAFLPGVTAATSVSDTSGRGVGLDAVRTRIERVGGSVRLDSRPGAGTTVTLLSPITLALAQVLVVEAAGHRMCLPLGSVERVVRSRADDLVAVEEGLVLHLDGRAAPVVDVAVVAGMDASASGAATLTLVVLSVGDRTIAVAVDAVIETAEIVVQPVPERVPAKELLLGLTVLANGAPAIVLNVAAASRRAQDAGPATGVTVATADRAERRRVLVVEDTITTRTLEVSILRAAGYDVLAAGDGLEAWEILERDPVDVVVSDVDMPRLDGIELCRRIRASSRLRDLPVVLVTSLGTVDDRQRGLEAGADAYVVKSSFEQGTLLDAVARVR